MSNNINWYKEARRTSNVEKSHIRAKTALIIYTCCILYITIISRNSGLIRSVRPIPFWSYADWLRGNWERGLSIILNIILFIPLGYLISATKKNATNKRHLWVSVICSAVLSLTIETIQFISYHGTCDFDDLINNVLGGWIGAALYCKCQSMHLNDGIRKALPIALILFGLAGCLKEGIPASKGDGTAYEKQFSFDITEVKTEKDFYDSSDIITLIGYCKIYTRDNLPFQLILVGEESGIQYSTETSIDKETFIAIGSIPNDEKYEVQVIFKGYKPIPTSTFIRNNTIEYVSGYVPSPAISDTELEGIIAHGILKAYKPENDVYVYQVGKKLYWLVGKDIDDRTVILYHIHTNELEKLPENRRQFGFDNRQFKVGSDKEIGFIGPYRIFEAEIPTEYNVTAIVVGFSTGGIVSWKQHFRVNSF